MKHPEVIKLLADLQAIHRQRHTITIDDILQELEQTRLLALKNKQCSAAISATMSKAKLLGLDKQVIEHSNHTQNIVVTFEEANKVRDLTD